MKTLLGVTKAKKKLKRDLGITAAMKPFRFWTNQKRRLKRKVGYESTPWRIARNGMPTPGGCAMTLVLVGGFSITATIGLMGIVWTWG
jgi:hypothetical protein